jgi:hypothetical protein
MYIQGCICTNQVITFTLAGNRNRTSGGLNNQGANANYWASTPNGTNAYNLNFNSTNLNPQNNNNRANGFSVRCFQHSQFRGKVKVQKLKICELNPFLFYFFF